MVIGTHWRSAGRSAPLLLALFLLAPLASQAEDVQPLKNAGPYVPSPQSVVADMLKLAEVSAEDFVIDLGSGDGRIVLTAAKVFGARGFGVEIKEDLVKLSNEAAAREGIEHRVRFLAQDLFRTDISQATVLTMYLLPDTVNMLSDKLLKELRPGTRVLSHDYPLTGWVPEKYVHMDLEDKVKISGVTTTLIYLYVIPVRAAGRWSVRPPGGIARQMTIEFTQELNKLAGKAMLDGRHVSLTDAKLRGDRLSFRLVGRRGEFTGQVKDGAIEGVFDSGGSKSPWSATLVH